MHDMSPFHRPPPSPSLPSPFHLSPSVPPHHHQHTRCTHTHPYTTPYVVCTLTHEWYGGKTLPLRWTRRDMGRRRVYMGVCSSSCLSLRILLHTCAPSAMAFLPSRPTVCIPRQRSIEWDGGSR